MSVRIVSQGNKVTAFIEGDIDHHSAKEIRQTIDEYIERFNPNHLVLDFGAVRFMDTSGIGLIMGRFKLMSALKGTLTVVNVPENLKRVFKLSGLNALGIFK